MKSNSLDYKLIDKDCVIGMREMEEQSVDVVVTSPPYNLGIVYGNYNDNRTRNEYLQWSRVWAFEVKRFSRGRAKSLVRTLQSR